MTLRRRLTLTVAGVAALALASVALSAYFVTRAELRGQVDDRLREQADLAARALDSRPFGGGRPPPGGRPFEVPRLPGPDGGTAAAIRVTTAGGEVLEERGDLPPAPASLRGSALDDAEVDGEHLRVLSAEAAGGTVQIGRSLESVDDALAGLRSVLFLVVAGGVGLAALGARGIAARLVRPVEELSSAAGHVSQTEDLSRRIEVEGDDEISRLGMRFNAMLARLEGSRSQLDAAHEEQQRLIADASHELRTPVTSLRTNIELIASGRLESGEEARAVAAATAQAAELGVLIGDLMDLARGEPSQGEPEELRFDELVGESVDRVRRDHPQAEIVFEGEDCIVSGSAERLARAARNLVVNAVEHGGGGAIEVRVRAGTLTVRDRGPGLEAAEVDRVFDRFFRGRHARRRPGSGLGLAIVRQVAEAHGGRVSAANAAGGGAIFTLDLGAYRA